MDNYYKLLDLDQGLSIAEINSELERLKKKYIKMLNSPKIEKQAEAQKMLKILDDATLMFQDEAARASYDYELLLAKTASEIEDAEDEDYSQTSQTDTTEYEKYYNQAVDAINTNNATKALEYASKAYNILPNDARANNLLAVANESFENYKEALHFYNESIKLDPTFGEAYCNAGILLVEQFNNEGEGIKRINQALDINPRHERSLYALGIYSMNKNNNIEAKGYFEKLAKYYPEDESYKKTVEELNEEINKFLAKQYESLADTSYKKRYFDSEEEFNDYISNLESAQKSYYTEQVEKKLKFAQSKAKYTIDFRWFGLFLILYAFIYIVFKPEGEHFDLIPATVYSVVGGYILHWMTIPKWKFEKRMKNPMFDSCLVTGILYFSSFWSVTFILIYALSNFIATVFMIVFYVLFMKLFSNKKHETKEITKN
ncbi:tetratricopeptide repeat protein [Macrococcoides canis]|uniref:tetratricopeptide repeat protein n=1 Tax=Macrococcoides canis TaxID=1855823 RepID=UPI0020B6DC54|nr:hypothetical protein [Macrococcus canis]UTH00504.1 hypothetical protein KFV04_02245 [Macrococcus canis]